MKRILVCCTFALAAILMLSGCADDEGMIIEEARTEESGLSSEPEEESVNGSGENESVPEKPEGIYVYLVGAVNKPGVYEVPSGTRLFQVVDFAGGFREDAAEEALNLAAVLQDGSVIRVPDREEYEAHSAEDPSIKEVTKEYGESRGSVLININTASVAELTTLNGIGESRAEAIVNYREENGAFGCVEDIKKVSGIKDGLFNKIRDKITV